MAGLSLVTPAGRDDLDREIERAEAAFKRADDQYQAMSHKVSHSESAAMLRVVKELGKKAEVLRAQKFAVIHGVDQEPVAQPEPTRPADDDELRKLIDTRISLHHKRSTAEDEELRTLISQARQHAVQVAETIAHGLRDQFTAEIKQAQAAREDSLKVQITKLLELREIREEAQLRLERQLLDQARELAELRDALRAARFIPPPALRSLPNGNNDNA